MTHAYKGTLYLRRAAGRLFLYRCNSAGRAELTDVFELFDQPHQEKTQKIILFFSGSCSPLVPLHPSLPPAPLFLYSSACYYLIVTSFWFLIPSCVLLSPAALLSIREKLNVHSSGPCAYLPFYAPFIHPPISINPPFTPPPLCSCFQFFPGPIPLFLFFLPMD